MDDVDNSPPESLVEGVVSLCKNAWKFIKQLNESQLPLIKLFFGSENLLIWFLEFWVNLINVFDQLFFLVCKWIFEFFNRFVDFFDFFD